MPNTVTLVISEEQHAKVKRIAELTGKSASAIVRDLIDSLPDDPVLMSHKIQGPIFLTEDDASAEAKPKAMVAAPPLPEE